MTARRVSIETRRASRGETLIELIVAVTILASTGVAVIGGLYGATRTAAVDAERVTGHTLLVSAANSIGNPLAAAFVPCARASDYATIAASGAPHGYRIGVADVEGWSGTGWSGPVSLVVDAPAGSTQLTVTNPTTLPAKPPYPVVVGPPAGQSESLTVQSVSGDVLTLAAATTADHLTSDTSQVQACLPVQRVTLQVTTPGGATEQNAVAVRAPDTIGEP